MENTGMDIEAFSPQGMEVQIRAEYDVQIMTAQRKKRDVEKVKLSIQKMAVSTPEMAASCFYSLPRKDANGQPQNIEGPSIRFAEIAIYNWENLRAGGRVVNVEEKFVDVEGVCHDLQTNNLIIRRVRRGIWSNKMNNGRGGQYSADMINVTANAGISIALRNAALTVIPGPIWKPIFEEVQRFAKGDVKQLRDRLLKYVASFSLMGITVPQLLQRLGRPTIEAITLDDLGILMGIYTSIKEGEAAAEEIFLPVSNGVFTSRPVAPQQEQAKAEAPAQATETAPADSNAAPTADASREGFAQAQNVVAMTLAGVSDPPPPVAPPTTPKTASAFTMGSTVKKSQTPLQKFNAIAIQIKKHRDPTYFNDFVAELCREHGDTLFGNLKPEHQEKVVQSLEGHLKQLDAEAARVA